MELDLKHLPDDIDMELLLKCIQKAEKVDFLSTMDELERYVTSLYNATIWARKVK